MLQTHILVLAAGKGKRIKRTDVPKVLVPVNGRPMIQYVLEAIKQAFPDSKPTIVVGNGAAQVQKELGPDYHYVLQKEQLGTGHAVGCARESLQGKTKNIIVLYGDKPLVDPDTLCALAATHKLTNAVLTMATITVPDFDGWREGFYDLGRIVRDEHGILNRVVEKKDATPEQLEIKELNPTYLCFDADWLWDNITKLDNNNAQGEYYLPDLLKMAFDQKRTISTCQAQPIEGLGINTEEQRQLAERVQNGSFK